MTLGVDTQTDRQHILTRKPKQFQETRRAWPLAMHAWFKNAALYGSVKEM